MKIPEDIVRELGNLPKSLRDLYSLAFSQVTDLGSTAQQIALNALKLTMFCIRPIFWDEFLDLLSFTGGLNRVPTKSEVLDMTFNFLEDDEESDQARFVHLSAREYFESRQDFSPAESSLTIAMLCVDSIRSLESNITNKFSYSAFFLPKHLSYTTTALRVPAKEPLEELLRPRSRLFAKWRKTIRSLHDAHVLASKRHLKNLDTYNKLDLVHTTEEALLSSDRIFAVCIMGLEEFVPLLSPTRFNIAVRYWNEWNDLAWPAEKAIDAYDGKTCLEMAVLFNRISILRKFHELGFDLSQQLNTDGETLLHVAAKNGTSAMTETLLTSNMDPNRLTQLAEPIIDNHPSTSDIGVHSGYPGRSSTSMGFRTNQGGKWGILSPFHLKQELNAPIHFAVARQDGWHITKVLIDHKADVNIRTSAGNTALQLALNAGKAKDQIIDLLLQAGADPNADLGQGQVLLHRSAAMGLEETVQLLLKAGANSRIKDFFGQTPYDLARRYGSLGITEILEPELPTPQLESPESPKSPEASSELTVPSISVDEAPALDSTTLSPSEDQTLADTERLSRHRRPLSKLVAREWKKLKLK
jgi:ankyrin repeat protein